MHYHSRQVHEIIAKRSAKIGQFKTICKSCNNNLSSDDCSKIYNGTNELNCAAMDLKCGSCNSITKVIFR
jgi:hypothetical protein